MGQHRPARSCQAQHRRAGTTPAAAQGLRRKQGARASGGEAGRPGPEGGGESARAAGREQEPGLRRGAENPGRGREAENPGRGRGAENPCPRTGSREPPGASRDGAPAAPGAAPRHQARRALQQTLRSAVRRCYPARGPAGQGRSARGSGVCRIFAGRRLCGMQPRRLPAPVLSGACRRGCVKPVKPRPVACATVSVGGTAAS